MFPAVTATATDVVVTQAVIAFLSTFLTATETALARNAVTKATKWLSDASA